MLRARLPSRRPPHPHTHLKHTRAHTPSHAQVRRPNNYDVNMAVLLGPTDPNPAMELSGLDIVRTVVADSPNKVGAVCGCGVCVGWGVVCVGGGVGCVWGVGVGWGAHLRGRLAQQRACVSWECVRE